MIFCRKAARMMQPAFQMRAISSRWLKQIASCEDVLTMAIFGLSMSSSDRPSASHCARLVAHREVPGS